MAKTITITHGKKTYTLEFTRRTVEIMERKGFDISDFEGKPMSTIPKIFYGAFLAHHPKLSESSIDLILADCRNKEELLKKLAEMYQETITSLFDEPEENEGNAMWTASE